MGLTADTPASVPSGYDGLDRLHLCVPDLRKLTVVVVVMIALSGQLPENSASDVRRYGLPVRRQVSRIQADRIMDLLRMMKKRRSSQVSIYSNCVMLHTIIS